MSETTAQTNGVTSQYAAQVASDLERNLKEYDRIAGEVAVLQEQLASLEKDRTVLLNVQQALGVESRPRPPHPRSNTPRRYPPLGRRPRSAPPAGRRRRSPKRRLRRPAVKKTASRKASPEGGPEGRLPAPAPKADQPSLVSLVREHLVGQGEPRSAAEVAQSLGQQYPERGIKTTVVRTTLEGLVAKNRAQRSKQGSSVFYTSPEAPAPTTSKEGAKEDIEEGAPQEGQSA